MLEVFSVWYLVRFPLQHMKNYEVLLNKISSWLVDGGLLFIHIFSHKQFAYHFEVSRSISERFVICLT